MPALNFFPFFERVGLGRDNGFTSKVVFSALLGFIYLIAHVEVVGDKVFERWEWLLSVLITIAMLSLYLASHTFRQLLVEISVRCDTKTAVVLSRLIKRSLSDRRFLFFGILFGVLNCAMGWQFGIPDFYVTPVQKATIYTGYFVAGFVSGMAVLGIYGVSLLIATFAYKAKHPFDFTFPDGCGGTLFLGEAISTFGFVTLVVGVFISVYIWKIDWSGQSDSITRLLFYVWIILPYIMALVALLAPAIPISTQLKKYKQKQDLYFQGKLAVIREKLESQDLSADDLKLLRAEYSYQLEDRARLHKMRTWPYGLGANVQYVVAAVPVFYASFEAISEHLHC